MAVDKCIVTGEELGERAELHHPMRDGRPPILLSKKGHDIIEQSNQKNWCNRNGNNYNVICKRIIKEFVGCLDGNVGK